MTVHPMSNKLHPHPRAAFSPFHHADHGRMALFDRHAIHAGNRSVYGFVFGFQDQGAGSVVTMDSMDDTRRPRQPAALFRPSQQRGETCSGIEARQT